MHAISPNYQYVNKRNLQWGLLGFIACMTYAWPYYFSILFGGLEPLLNLLARYGSYAITVFLLINFRSYKKITKGTAVLITLEILFAGLVVFFTQINGGKVGELEYVFQSNIAFMGLMIAATSDTRGAVIRGMAVYYKCVIFLTLLFALVPIANFGGVYNFLSTKNVYLREVFVGILLIGYTEYEAKKTVSINLIKWLCFVGITAICLGSSTAAFSSAVVVCLLVGIKKIDWLKEKISFRLMILVSIVITILVVFMQNVVFYSSFLKAVFGKDATFTGRTTLWAQALIRIAANPFIGGGHISEGDTSFLFGKEDIWFGVSCHNIYLDTAVETGLLGLALYLIILLYIGRKVDEYSQREKTALFASLYLIFFIACNFEIYLNGGQSIYLFPPLMFLYLSFDQ